MTTVNTDEFDQQFRLAMRRLAASVCVITSANQQHRFAMTATAVNSFSAEPPSLLICINKFSGLHKLLTQQHPFCVNILHQSQQEIAVRCSQKPDDTSRLNHDSWAENDNIPYLRNAQANIFCDHADSLSYASHTAFIGRIQNIYLNNEPAPLVYLNGQYRALP